MCIGYACLTVGVLDTNLRSCNSKNASEEKLLEIITYNLKSLKNTINFNINNQIKLFRISSDLIPFGSSDVNSIPWWDIFANEFKEIGEKIKSSGIRVSMHPGQYTVLNSDDEEVVKKATRDLNYHSKVLDSLMVPKSNKIIIHIGGVYQDKEQSVKRFIANYKMLSDSVKSRLVIENDDKSYNISEVLEIGKKLNMPVVFDNLHNKVNPSPIEKSEVCWIEECRKTWKDDDGKQKIHYSQQDRLKRPGGHSETIQIDEFINFFNSLENNDIDIMLEVKDKNLSAIKCINSVYRNQNIKELEVEWNRYKYKILENSKTDYLAIEDLLKNKDVCDAKSFYQIIEVALKKEGSLEEFLNAAVEVCNSIINKVSEREAEKFNQNIKSFKQGVIAKSKIKNNLWRLAVQYNETELMSSLYFIK